MSTSVHNNTRLTREPVVEIDVEGRALLDNPSLNKGSAFTLEERSLFNLEGLLPSKVNTLEDQVSRAYQQLSSCSNDLAKNQFMESLKYQNKVLYYALIQSHLKELMGIIYTPTQGDAIANYSKLFRRPYGCYLDINDPDSIEERLKVFGDSKDIDYICVSDGEAILGIGDQGVGGIGISSSKLALMTACGGLHPDRVIPVVLDCGTNNQELLDDPLYMGNRHPRIRGEKYDKLVDNLIQTMKKKYPDAVLHFEDFDAQNAHRLLERYQHVLPCFNDDIQGTGAVTMAALTGALRAIKVPLREARILISGAGSAGVGIAKQIADTLETLEKLTPEQARSKISLIDSRGLIVKNRPEGISEPERALFADDPNDPAVASVENRKDLKELVTKLRPHVLIGCSKQPGSFTKEIVQQMLTYQERPIILPMSNPTRLHEATPKDLIEWTDGKVLVATGSPFKPVNGRAISESNNCFIFPGIGLGAVLSRATRIDETMIAAAVDRLASLAPIHTDPNGPLLPDISDVYDISARIAASVVLAAKDAGLAHVEAYHSTTDSDLVHIPDSYEECYEWVKSQMWRPEYRLYRRIKY